MNNVFDTGWFVWGNNRLEDNVVSHLGHVVTMNACNNAAWFDKVDAEETGNYNYLESTDNKVFGNNFTELPNSAVINNVV